MLFLGCDGGSTKFTYLVADEWGQLRVGRSLPGLNTIAMGEEAFYRAFAEQLRSVLQGADIAPEALTHSVLSITGYGESKESEQASRQMGQAVLGHGRYEFVNDAVAGWSGALMGRPGISVASGTGSVAYGEDGRGGRGRAGGWSLIYGDEGSAYWVAKQAVNAFFRQADGRAEKTRLYGHFLSFFQLQDPLHLPMELEHYTRGEVSALAALQREVVALYQAGDPCAAQIYRQAGEELAQLVAALWRRLDFPPREPVRVSYSGGLFRAGACVTEPFLEAVRALGARPQEPRYGPAVGAVCYAAREHCPAAELEGLYEKVAAAWARENSEP